MMNRIASGVILKLLVVLMLSSISNIPISKMGAAVSMRVEEVVGKSEFSEESLSNHYLSLASSEPPIMEWNKTYGGTECDQANSVVQTDDGGYAICGTTNSSGAGRNDLWLVKTDALGNEQWDKTYGGPYCDSGQVVVKTADGGYALAGGRVVGWTHDMQKDWDFWLIKTGEAGNTQWSKTYGGREPEYIYSAIQTSDGGYALAGATDSFGARMFDCWLVKSDSQGNPEWNKTYGGISYDYALSMVQTSDGGYILAGFTCSFGAGASDFWLVKVGSSGNMEWNRTYGGEGDDTAYSVVQTSDEGYVITGATNSLFSSGSFDVWTIKTDTMGNPEWNKTYGGSSTDWAESIVQTKDGGFAIAGSTSSFGAGSYDFWLIKVDEAGNMQWNKTFGGAKLDMAHSLVQTSDGGYAMVGYTKSFGAGNDDFWLIKTDSYGNGATSPLDLNLIILLVSVILIVSISTVLITYAKKRSKRKDFAPLPLLPPPPPPLRKSMHPALVPPCHSI